jgi:hypothetical protein
MVSSTIPKIVELKSMRGNNLNKIDFRIFGVGYSTPEEEITSWLNNQMSFLKIEGFKNPAIKVYENNTLIAENKLS